MSGFPNDPENSANDASKNSREANQSLKHSAENLQNQQNDVQQNVDTEAQREVSKVESEQIKREENTEENVISVDDLRTWYDILGFIPLIPEITAKFVQKSQSESESHEKNLEDVALKLRTSSSFKRGFIRCNSGISASSRSCGFFIYGRC